MTDKQTVRRRFRWILSAILVVLGVSVSWAWGRVVRLAEPPTDAEPPPAVLYAAFQATEAGQMGLFRSTDEGSTWQPLALPAGVTPLAWAADAHDRLALFSDDGKLLRSADRGDNWTTVETDLPILSLVWDEVGNLYLGTAGYGLYRQSADGTLTALTAAGSELASSPIAHLAYVDGRLLAATPGVLFASDDGGQSWHKALPLAGGQITALAATGRDTIFVGTETTGVYRSSDGGRSWQPAWQGLGLAAGQMVRVTALQTDPQEAGVLYAAVDYVVGASELHASAGGVFVTVDHGALWQPLAGPVFPEAEHVSALVLPVGRPLHVQAVTPAGFQSYSPDIEAALVALESGDRQLRLTAIRILGLARAGQAGEALLSALADPDPAISLAAATALGRLDDPVTAGGLLLALEHPSEQVRLGAARALGVRKVAGAVQPLRAMLLGGDGLAVSTAAEALGRIGGPAATDALLAALADVDMTPRRHAALAALESLGEPAVVPLKEMLTGADPYARSNAAEALGWIGSPAATGALVQALGDKSSLVRDRAAWALGEIGDPAARKALERAARRDPAAAVRAEASRSLARLEQAPVSTAGWITGLALALDRLQALRWSILVMSLAGSAWLAMSDNRLAAWPVRQQGGQG